LNEPVDLLRALGPVLIGDYYRYKGGLTTPSCDEIVQWFVFKTSLSMSQAQWESFKSIFPNPANNRPVQPLNTRKVAINQFEAPEQDYTPVKWEFWLDRKHGRNREDPAPYVILGGVIGGVVIGILIMGATFIRQNPIALGQSAGGLTANAEQVGRSRYGRMADRM